MSDSNITIANGVKLVGESMLPGASLLLDGNLVNGAAHVAAGAAAAAFVAPWAVLLVVADSFSKSVSGKNLWDHINVGKKASDVEVVAA
jgi:hypothetical protein